MAPTVSITPNDQTPIYQVYERHGHYAFTYVSLVGAVGASLLLLPMLSYVCMTRNYQPPDPEIPEDHSSSSTPLSSSSAYSESRDIQHIDSILPSTIYSEAKVKAESAGPMNQPRCDTCQKSVKNGDEVRVLPCGHMCHSACFITWYLKRHYSCPVCSCRYIPEGTPELPA